MRETLGRSAARTLGRLTMIRLIPLVALVLLIAAPFALRPVAPPPAKRQVIVITPHGEQIRAEFGRAFAAAVKADTGEEVGVDWRTPGGTSEIVRMLDAQYALAFADGAGRSIPNAARAGFTTDRILDKTPPDLAAQRTQARAAFLASDTGCGYDVFFGGGEFPHRNLAGKGYLVDAGVQAAHPDWFAPAVMPQAISGETVYDAKGRYYGACFSVFGICSSDDRLRALGLAQPTRWADLADPRLLDAVTFADPTKSGVVVTVLERMLQERIRLAAERRLAAEHQLGDSNPATIAASPEDLEAGWTAMWTQVKGMAGNARFVTDGASKAVRDVARGDAAAGFAIDFHARSEADWSAHETGGKPRLSFAVPAGGTSVSADPIALLRGAPNRDLAVRFITFVLSPEGQRLWNYRAGSPGGPAFYNLRRMPVRSDVLTADDRVHMTDPDIDPFAVARSFTYRPAWTRDLYGYLAPHTKAVVLDALPELQAAWRAIIAAGGPDRVPQAAAAFAWVPCTRAEALALMERKELDDPVRRLAVLRGWTVAAIDRYRQAAALAAEGR
jgi:iron(III) transport system substrate-binding protein